MARNIGPHQNLKGNAGQHRLPHRVSLGDLLPADLLLASKWRTGVGHRSSRREEASERTPPAFDWGQLGTVTEHVPCGFRSTHRPRDERPLVVRIA